MRKRAARWISKQRKSEASETRGGGKLCSLSFSAAGAGRVRWAFSEAGHRQTILIFVGGLAAHTSPSCGYQIGTKKRAAYQFCQSHTLQVGRIFASSTDQLVASLAVCQANALALTTEAPSETRLLHLPSNNNCLHVQAVVRDKLHGTIALSWRGEKQFERLGISTIRITSCVANLQLDQDISSTALQEMESYTYRIYLFPLTESLP